MSQLKWRDSEDVYKPTNLSLWSFLQRNTKLIQGITHLHKKLITQEMSVFVRKAAEEKLIEHLSIDPNNETGGVLVGQAYFCPDTKHHYTEIVGSIAALYTIGNRVHFRFTTECWQEILRIQKQEFAGTTIVGWYHSHPGHGIFLSGTDLNTQRLSFKQIWQIATVYDPIRNQIGYFYSADGKKLEFGVGVIYLVEQLDNQPDTSTNLAPQLEINTESSQPRELYLENNSPHSPDDENHVPSNQRTQNISAGIDEDDLADLDRFLLDIKKILQIIVSIFIKKQ